MMNGRMALVSLIDEKIMWLAGDIVEQYYDRATDKLKVHDIFNGIILPEYVAIVYENYHLTPFFEDVNDDGYIDIVLSGNMVCYDFDSKKNLIS